jgi:hypothetical protein
MNKNIIIWIIGIIMLCCSVMAVPTLRNNVSDVSTYISTMDSAEEAVGTLFNATGTYNLTNVSFNLNANTAATFRVELWNYSYASQRPNASLWTIQQYNVPNVAGWYNFSNSTGYILNNGSTYVLTIISLGVGVRGINGETATNIGRAYRASTTWSTIDTNRVAFMAFGEDITIPATAPTLTSNLSNYNYLNYNFTVLLNISNNNATTQSCFISSTNSNFSCTTNYTANNLTIIPCFFSQSNTEQNTTLTPYCNSSSYNITATNKTIYFDDLNPRITTAINNSIIINQTNFWFYINDLTTMIFNISDSCNGTYTNTTGTATGNYTYPINYSSITKNCALGINWINITSCDNLSQCSTSINYWHKFNISSSQLSTIYEGTQADYSLLIKYPNINQSFNISAYLNQNSINYSVTRKDLDNDTINYTQSIIIGNISSITWAWYYNLSDIIRNLSGTQSVINMNITNCSNSTYMILNFTMYDEEYKTLINATENTTIETFITLYVPQNTSISYKYSAKNNNTLLVCLPDNYLTYGSLILDGVTKYYTDSYVTEYYYIDNFNLTNAVVPKYISLYDLITTDSTSFLITYQDENYLYKENVIIDMLRKYIPDNGNFISVEHGKTDEGGQTNLHLVTEDIIYKFNVWENGELVYTTNEYKALCQASPCQINLRKKSESTDFSSETSNILYSITQQEVFSTTKLITLSYSTKDGTSAAMVMTVLLNNQTVVCNETSTSSAGSLNCNVPLVYQNSTYITNVYKDSSFIGYKIYVLGTKLSDSLGSTGYFLAGIVDLLFILMGVLSSSTTITMIFAAIGLLLTGLIGLVFMGNYIGIGSIFIYILIAIGIIIWKLRQRRFN